MKALAKMVKRPCYGGISPRRTARRLTPILEAQAKATAASNQTLWIELGRTEQVRQVADEPHEPDERACSPTTPAAGAPTAPATPTSAANNAAPTSATMPNGSNR